MFSSFKCFCGQLLAADSKLTSAVPFAITNNFWHRSVHNWSYSHKLFVKFLTLKNCAYIDANNCPFALQLLADGIAQDTGYSKISGYCEYPLWVFKEDFLKEIGGDKYERYSEQFDAYMRTNVQEDDTKMDEMQSW